MKETIQLPGNIMDPLKNIYAGFWKRFFAHLIDRLILSIVGTIIYIPFFVIMIAATGLGEYIDNYEQYHVTSFFQQNQLDEETAMMIGLVFLGFMFVTFIVNTIVEWLYFALMESSKYQATLGKMALSLKVTDMDRNKISFGKATGRYFGKYISGLIFMVGYIMAAFTEKKQALHDIMANCLVLDKQKEFILDNAIYELDRSLQSENSEGRSSEDDKDEPRDLNSIN